MPKKSPKNAFFYYMLHFKKEECRRGRYYPGGFAEISRAASKSWKEMNGQQRGRFEKEAKDGKVGPRMVVEKYTSQGIPLSVIDKEQKQLESDRGTMLNTIKSTVLDAFNNNTIGSREFFFISGNYFLNIDENYLPAEIAMVKFTFENGIVNKFHTYVDPENVPLGYRFDAIENSDKTHRLPIPPKAKGERNYKYILNEMKKFWGETSPILFTSKAYIPMIKSFMQMFVNFENNDDAGPDDRNYRVYPLHQLFFEIKEEAVKCSIEGKSFRSIHVAEEYLRREDYAYLAGTACTYHDDLDCAKHCALAHVQNWAYIFVDHILVDLNIQPIAGKHFPPEIDISVSKLTGDTENTTTYTDEGHSSRSVAWPKSPVSKLKRNDNFPTLGSSNNRKRSNQKRSGDNPWNTSSSSSDSESGFERGRSHK